MRVLSGIQPTGTVHLGNYFGALANWVKLQNEGHECFFSIVNQHAITLPQNPAELSKNTLEVAATLFAVGLDPNKSTIFVQSDVVEISQLAWILNCLAPIGQMERMIQFKEKSEKDPDATNVGLLTYPILQAADILAFRVNLVPVGVDQSQHLELTRVLAEKFNRTYKEIFPVPKTLHTETTKVVGLDGGAKMSKSQNNYIGLTESEDAIWKKLAAAATDPARVKRTDPGNPLICNIYSLHKLFSNQEDQEWVVEGCRSAKIGCIECKRRLFSNMSKILAPFREKYNEIIADKENLKQILAEGAKKASSEAQKTLKIVYEAVGFKY